MSTIKAVSFEEVMFMSNQEYKPHDVQTIKRELLRQGHLQGFLTDEEIIARLPKGLITSTELETFFFTLEMMGIERK